MRSREFYLLILRHGPGPEQRQNYEVVGGGGLVEMYPMLPRLSQVRLAPLILEVVRGRKFTIQQSLSLVCAYFQRDREDMDESYCALCGVCFAVSTELYHDRLQDDDVAWTRYFRVCGQF